MTAPRVMPPGVLVLDWDNTLVDTFPLIGKALNTTLSAFGKPTWTMQEVHTRVGRSGRDIFPKLFGAVWKDALAHFTATVEAAHLDHLVPFPGTESFLNACADLGLPLAVLSNKQGPLLRPEVEALGWNDHFVAVIGAGDAKADKPDPIALYSAVQKTHLDPGPHVWFAGDHWIDLECSWRAGCQGVLVGAKPHGSPPDDHPEQVLHGALRVANIESLTHMVQAVGVHLTGR